MFIFFANKYNGTILGKWGNIDKENENKYIM